LVESLTGGAVFAMFRGDDREHAGTRPHRKRPPGGCEPAQGCSLAARESAVRPSALGLSTWLNAGVHPTEVAERADNSVEVLPTRYAKCIDGRQEIANRKIEELLREYE
jgi:hypothetical protein